MKKDALQIALLAFLAVLPYVCTLGYGPVGIESELYGEDYRVMSGGYLGELILGDYLGEMDDVYRHGTYRPLAGLSVLADNTIFNNAVWGRHLVNIALHLAAVLGLFFLLRSRESESMLPLWAAALFSVHPMAAEAVAWVPGRPPLLCGALLVWGLWAGLKYVLGMGRQSAAWLMISFIAVFLALGAHPAAFAAPLLFWLICPKTARQEHKGRFRLVASLLVAAPAAYLVLRISAGVWPRDKFDPGAFARIATWPVGLWETLGRLFVPINHQAFIEIPWAASPVADWRFWVFGVLSPALAFGLWHLRNRAPGFVLGVLWIFFAFLPVSNLLPVYAPPDQGWPLAERSLYPMAAGAAMAAAYLLIRLRGRWQYIVGVPLVVLGFAATFHRAGEWDNAQNAYASSIEAGDSAVVLNELGVDMMHRQDAQAAAGLFMRAVMACTSEEAYAPVKSDALLNLASAQLVRQQFGGAKRYAEQARDAGSDPVKQAYVEALIALRVDGDYETALAKLDRCLELRPKLPPALAMRARIKSATEDGEGARQDLETALRLWPGHPALSMQLGMMLAKSGDYQAAWEVFQTALKRGDPSVELLNQAASALIELARYDEAEELLLRALDADPEQTEAMIGLGACCYRRGDIEQARSWLLDARRIDPDNAMINAFLEQLEGPDSGGRPPAIEFPVFQNP